MDKGFPRDSRVENCNKMRYEIQGGTEGSLKDDKEKGKGLSLGSKDRRSLLQRLVL